MPLALEISSVSTAGFAASGARATVALSNRVPQSGITVASDAVFQPGGTSPGRFVEVRATLNRADSRTALDIAVAAGTGILSALKDLRRGFQLAGSSLVNPSANIINGDGTRVSALNVQAQAKILLRAIDNLVETAEINGTNLISSKGRPVKLQTTAFGGSLRVQPQPLDSAGLGLDDINLIRVGGVNGALSAVGNAIIQAEGRLERLETLQRVSGGASFNRQFLANVVSGFGGSSPDRGTLIDLVG